MNREYIITLLKKNRCGRLMKLAVDNVHNWSHDDYSFLYKNSVFYNNVIFRLYMENNVILKEFRNTYKSLYKRVYINYTRGDGIEHDKAFCEKNNYNISGLGLLKFYDDSRTSYDKDLFKYMLELFEYGVIDDKEFQQSINHITNDTEYNFNEIYRYMHLLTSKKFYMLSNNADIKFNKQYRIFLTDSRLYYNKYMNIVCDILNMNSDIIDVVVHDILIRYIMIVNIKLRKNMNIPMLLKHYIENTNMKMYANIPIIKKHIDYATELKNALGKTY